jgi:phospholipid/cholesterol/gamma-HCH transport system permease protein
MAGGFTNRMAKIFGWTGRRVMRSLLYAVDLTVFIIQASKSFFRRAKGRNSAYRPLMNQVIFTGVDALPMISFLALVIGLSLVVLFLPLAAQLATPEDSAALLADMVGLEFSSVITAIIVAGRSGTSLAVFVGNMRLNREIEALEHLGFDVNHFLIAPPLFAAAISQLVLATYFGAFALFGGVILAGAFISRDFLEYFTHMLYAFHGWQVAGFMLKNLIFGLIIGAAACFHGLKVSGSPTELPQQVQRAIVGSLVLVFIVDAAFILALR